MQIPVSLLVVVSVVVASGKRAEGAGPDVGMVRIPAGCFRMGSDSGRADEKPVHEVCLSAFSMDVTEVTNAAYERSGKRGHYEDAKCFWFKDGKRENVVVPARFRKGDQPVVCVD